MRKVVVYALVSLDGVATSPEEFVHDWDEVMDANLAAVIATQDEVVLGRRSHDEWAAYWPMSEVEPFASFINPVPKLVATSTPLTQEWTAVEVVDGDLLAAVRERKTSTGGDIGVHASISVVQSLLAGGVVDEVRLVVAPALGGPGRRLLDGLPPARWHLVDSVTSPTGSLLLHYRVPTS